MNKITDNSLSKEQEQRLNQRTLSEDIKLKIIDRLWAGSHFIRLCYTFIAVAFIIAGVSWKGAVALIPVGIVFAWTNARHLREERLLRKRSDASTWDCFWSWSVAPSYIATFMAIVIASVL